MLSHLGKDRLSTPELLGFPGGFITAVAAVMQFPQSQQVRAALVAVHRLLLALASLAVACRLWGRRASVVAAHRLSGCSS